MPSYWCPRKRTDEEMAQLMQSLSSSTTTPSNDQDPGHIEPVTGQLADKNVVR